MSTIEEWAAQGPYTMAELFKWVELKKESDYDFAELLDRTFHLFTGKDLRDLVSPVSSLTKAGYQLWLDVVGSWTPSKINGKLSASQLWILVDANVIPQMDADEFKRLPAYTRYKWFKHIRNYHRDQSPKRK
jgi:hypothetical protein